MIFSFDESGTREVGHIVTSLILIVDSRDKQRLHEKPHKVVGKVKSCAEKLGCTRVFFCSDNERRKAEIKQMLTSGDMHCMTYDAVLSSNENVGLHFTNVPADAQCRDVAIEIAMMARYCKGLLCTRSNMSFMVAVLADENYEVFDMLSDRHVGPMPSMSSATASSVESFRSDLDNNVEGMWLDHDICVVQLLGSKCAHDFVSMLKGHVIINGINDYEEEVDPAEVASRLGGFLAKWHEIQVVKITKFDPPRDGWGSAQSQKLRKQAAALSVLVPLLLDKRGGRCDNKFVSAFCTAAVTSRPPAA